MSKFIAVGIGFSMLCPTLLVDTVSVRLTDVMVLLLDCAAGFAILSSSWPVTSIPIVAIVISVLTCGWVGAELTFSEYVPQDLPAAMILVRWLVAIPAAFYLANLCEDRIFLKNLVRGAIAGCVVVTLLLAFDYVTFQRQGVPAFPGDAPGVFYVEGAFRAAGIFGHPNGAAIGSLFIVPFLIGASEASGGNRWLPAVVLPIMGATFYFTQTRGALVSASFLLVIWFWKRRPTLTIASVVASGVLLALAYTVNPLILTQSSGDNDLIHDFVTRFTADSAMEDNASSRLDTTLTSLELMFQHPFGMGSTYEAPLEQITGFSATHDGLLQLGLLGGFPLAALVTVYLVRAALNVISPNSLTYQWVGLYLFLVSLFESVFFLPYFSILILWVIACSSGSQSSAVAAGQERNDPATSVH